MNPDDLARATNLAARAVSLSPRGAWLHWRLMTRGLAEFRAGPQRLIDELAILFLIVRIAYVFTYLGNRPTLRSILWSIGFAINLAIFFMPAIRSYLPI